ncbi:hypothetical protein ACIA8H_13010 [Streptomyces goshikiensis]|uniref:hypothetical protein n=1 Tax=Streptomyces goshikiensis TaxID=1942 RepID=UPI0037AD1F10
MESYKSEEVRTALKDVLNAARFEGKIAKVVRYRDPMAYVVPPEWFERACEALGVDPENPDEPPTTA